MNEIWAIVLAAGESSRMQSPKMILPFQGKTIIETVLSNVARSEVANSIIVLGAWRDEILQVISEIPVLRCINENYKSGMLSSVQCAVRNVAGSAAGMLIFPGDQPMVGSKIINMVISGFNTGRAGIVIPCHEGHRGHPVLISTKYRDEILSLGRNDTLRTIMENHPDDILEVEVPSSSVTLDLDTPDDYLNVLK
jgi:molybdenum cofactor cytidylyltransferase